MYGNQVISGVLNQAFNSRVHADNLLRVAGLDPRVLRGTAPVNDEVPPNGITGLAASPIYQGMHLTWDLTPAEDSVRKAVVEVTPEGEDTYEVEAVSDVEATIFGLEGVPHDFRVKVVDLWDLESAWSAVITATPITTAATDINLFQMQQMGKLQGLIDAINLAGPTAQQGIQGVALAGTQANNMLPLIESDMEMWNNTSQWPPPDARLADTQPVDGGPIVQGARIISSGEPAGHNLTMERNLGHWKMKHTRATPSTNYVIPVTQWREERRVAPDTKYFAQATVTGPAGAVVSIAVENASDNLGAGLSTANEETVTLGGGTQKIAVSFVGSADKPYVRIRLGLFTDNTTVYWYKFMLEEARPNATEPSPWNAGILATGSVAAHTITGLNANVAEAVIGKAAIQDGMIANLKVDKLIAGRLDVGIEIKSAGKIVGAGATIDANGIYLANQNRNPDANDGANGFPNNDSIGDWLTNNPYIGSGSPQPHSGIGFFDDHNDPRRGILVRSRGVSGGSNRDGYIDLLATSGGTSRSAETSAFVVLRAERPGKPGTVVIGQHLIVSGTIALPNNAIGSNEIGGLEVRKLTGGGTGQTIDKGLLPNLAGHNGDLPWDRITQRPDMGKYVTGQELANKGYRDAEAVRSIVKDMVKEGSLKQ